MKNPYDEITKKVYTRIEKASSEIANRFKGMKPYDERKVPMGDMLKAYDGLTPEDMQFFIQRHGEDKVNELIESMEKERLKQLERSYGRTT